MLTIQIAEEKAAHFLQSAARLTQALVLAECFPDRYRKEYIISAASKRSGAKGKTNVCKIIRVDPVP